MVLNVFSFFLFLFFFLSNYPGKTQLDIILTRSMFFVVENICLLSNSKLDFILHDGLLSGIAVC
jgi:hypothetical protein